MFSYQAPSTSLQNTRLTSPAEPAKSQRVAMTRTTYPLGPLSKLKPREPCRTPSALFEEVQNATQDCPHYLVLLHANQKVKAHRRCNPPRTQVAFLARDCLV